MSCSTITLNCHPRTDDVSQEFQEPSRGNAVLGAGGMQRAWHRSADALRKHPVIFTVLSLGIGRHPSQEE